jgi:hypothetical protein
MKHERRRAHIEKANARAAWRRSLEELWQLTDEQQKQTSEEPADRVLELLDDEESKPHAGR